MKVIGIRKVNYTKKDGTNITGTSYYVTEPILEKDGEGVSADNAFFSTATLENFKYRPLLGDEIEVLYNRYGRPYLIRPASSDDDLIIE